MERGLLCSLTGVDVSVELFAFAAAASASAFALFLRAVLDSAGGGLVMESADMVNVLWMRVLVVVFELVWN